MTLSRNEAREKLELACLDQDPEGVSEAFASQSLNADDATAALEDAQMDPTIIRALFEHGADPSSIDIRDIPQSEKVDELLILLDEYDYDFKRSGHLILQDFARDKKSLDWLLDRGVDINRTDNGRLDSGFHLARGEKDESLHLLNKVSADGDIDLFDHLVSRGADASKSLALHSASRCNDPDMSMAMVCHLLDKHKMDINSHNDDFRDFFHNSKDTGTPICGAILHKNLAVLNELLLRGASVNDPRSSPVDFAVVEGGFMSALEPLLRAGADPTDALMSTVNCLNIAAAQTCLKYAANPVPALHKALEQQEERTERIASNAAF